ncbi:hypothetical protein ABZX38_10125 [Streptomyces longwoodensis]|uniref:hypothetical protein n=1 Tax=Streptomyces longwoodensis TaxID=68231 RepID=UPI0033A8C01D
MEVVVEDADRFGVARVEPVQQRGDRIVPRAEAPGEVGVVVGRSRAGPVTAVA